MLGELPRGQRPAEDVERRPAAVTGVGEHVVDRQQSALAYPRSPAVEVGAGSLFRVSTVDEHQVGGRSPQRRDVRGATDDGDDEGGDDEDKTPPPRRPGDNG